MRTPLILGAVNVDHIATIRQVRNTSYPHLMEGRPLVSRQLLYLLYYKGRNK